MTKEHSLSEILRSGSTLDARRFFEGIPKSELAPHAAQLRDWLRVLDAIPFSWSLSDPRLQPGDLELLSDIDARLEVATEVLMRCGSWRDVRDRMTTGLALRACGGPLLERRPAWLPQFVAACCDLNPGFQLRVGWSLARSLVQAGAVAPPDLPGYALGALPGIWHDEARDQPRPCAAELVRRLRSHPDWLRGAFWLLFEHDGTAEVSLTNAEKYGEGKVLWTEALVELSRVGVLDRQRLLDASLAALARDFIQFRAGWFSRFHEAMKPSPAERAARLDAYLGLLGSAIPPTVSFAVKAVSLVFRDTTIPHDRLFPALRPVLAARAGATVKAALELLSRAVSEAGVEVRRRAAREAVTALLNASPGVQANALDLITRLGDPRDSELLRLLADPRPGLSATNRKRLDAWLGDGASEPAVSAPTTTQPSPDSAPAGVPPIATLTELLDTAGHVLEHPEDTLALERMLDGVARLGAGLPADAARLTGPLRKQVETTLRRRSEQGGMTAKLIAEFLLGWLDASRPLPLASGDLGWLREDAVADGCANRLSGILTRVRAGCRLPLLSAPDVDAGRIRPDMLVERQGQWKAAGQTPDPFDLELATLRASPGAACEARYTWTLKPGEYPGLILNPVTPGARAGGGPDALGGSEPLVSRFHRRPDLTPFSASLDGSPVLDEAAWRWHAECGDGLSEAYFHRASPGLHCIVNGAESDQRSLRAVVVRLLRPGLHPGPVATLALVLALGSRDDAFSLPALDALAAWVEDGRFDSLRVAQTMSQLMPSGMPWCLRWSAKLYALLARSPAHARAVAHLMPRVEVWRENDPSQPRDLARWLEVMLEALTETRLPLPAEGARVWLARLAGKSRAAALAERLLALPSA